MPTERPLLTVAIPTYNCAHFLPDAIGSILRQGLDDFELLILDNASEDNTEEVVRSFGVEQIRYIRNPSNLGSRENGNQCMLNARGKYIKFLCADDVLLDGVLKKQLSVLESRPEVSLVTCDNFITNENLEIVGKFVAFPGVHPGSRVINACLSWIANYIGGPSNVMFRREQVANLVVDPTYSALSDWKYYLEILRLGWYANIGQVGCMYRLHPTSDTQTNCPLDLRVSEHLRLVGEFDAWNLLGCIKALRLARSEGWHAIGKHWREALRPERMTSAAMSVPDIVRMYYLTHFYSLK
jgi:glycosyltransferase involved in cell wall biosynthesis